MTSCCRWLSGPKPLVLKGNWNGKDVHSEASRHRDLFRRVAMRWQGAAAYHWPERQLAVGQ